MYNWFSHYNDIHIYDLSHTHLKYCTKYSVCTENSKILHLLESQIQGYDHI